MYLVNVYFVLLDVEATFCKENCIDYKSAHVVHVLCNVTTTPKSRVL